MEKIDELEKKLIDVDVKVKDGRIGLVYAVAKDGKHVMIVFDNDDGIAYPLVDNGFFDGAVSVPIDDIIAVL